jgi:formate dehydrogenase maturation protein FdhE
MQLLILPKKQATSLSSNMNNINKGWIDAAKILSENPSAKVLCPVCKIGELNVKDEIVISEKKIDRYLICNTCGKWNVLTIAASAHGPDIN